MTNDGVSPLLESVDNKVMQYQRKMGYKSKGLFKVIEMGNVVSTYGNGKVLDVMDLYREVIRMENNPPLKCGYEPSEYSVIENQVESEVEIETDNSIWTD